MLALRNRVFFRIGIRNIRRRPGRSALIVVGLDARHGHHRRGARHGRHHEPDRSLLCDLGPRAGRRGRCRTGVEDRSRGRHRGRYGTRYFPRELCEQHRRVDSRLRPRRRRRTRRSSRPIAVQDSDDAPERAAHHALRERPRAASVAFGAITSDGKTVSLADLAPGEVYLNAEPPTSSTRVQATSLRILAGRNFVTAMREGDRPLRRRGNRRFRAAPSALGRRSACSTSPAW